MNSPKRQPEEPCRNWVELPRDVTASILSRLGPIDILANAQRVCSSWRSICKDPSMWRSINMHNLDGILDTDYDLEDICRRAVDRSAGGLVDISIEHFGTDDLLKYITDRSRHLKRLSIVYCYVITDKGLSEVAAKVPFLEELELSYCSFSTKALEVVGRCCPLLRSFKLNSQGCKSPAIESDEEALTIAETMPGLRQLQIFGSKLTNEGLQAILDGCPHLESLDLRQCFNINLEGNLGKRCAEQIKDLRRPYDSTDDYPYNPGIAEGMSSEDGYPSGFSDVDFLSDDGDYFEFSDGNLSDYGGSDISYYGD